MFLSGINGSERVMRMQDMMKEVAILDLKELVKMLHCGIWCIQIDVKLCN